MKQTSNSCSGARLIPLRYITGGMIGAMEHSSIVPQPLGEVLREYEIPPLPSAKTSVNFGTNTCSYTIARKRHEYSYL